MVDVCHDVEKDEVIHLMKEIMHEENKTFVFIETRRKMREDGWPAMGGIHGDSSQQKYDWVLNGFKHGRSILIITDVVSRGRCEICHRL